MIYLCRINEHGMSPKNRRGGEAFVIDPYTLNTMRRLKQLGMPSVVENFVPPTACPPTGDCLYQGWPMCHSYHVLYQGWPMCHSYHILYQGWPMRHSYHILYQGWPMCHSYHVLYQGWPICHSYHVLYQGWPMCHSYRVLL